VRSAATPHSFSSQQKFVEMPRIEDDIKLDFKDVLIRPKRSTLKSRSQVSLERTFTFKHSKFTWTGVPIMAANM
jgi:GMP reductase